MEVHLSQVQLNQITQALWGMSHAFSWIAEAIVFSAILRALANK